MNTAVLSPEEIHESIVAFKFQEGSDHIFFVDPRSVNLDNPTFWFVAPCLPTNGQKVADVASAVSADLYRELKHLVDLLEPMEHDGGLNVPGLATLNGARVALARFCGHA